MKLNPLRIGLIVLAAALSGVTIFGLFAANISSVTDLDREAAMRQFQAVVDSLDSGPARLQRDGAGNFTNTAPQADRGRPRPSTLGVLVFRPGGNQVIRSDIPFWFFRLKGPAARFALRGSGLDMDRLGITPGDIARQGPGVILDEKFADGGMLLVWAE